MSTFDQELRRGARVVAADGPVGHVSHVIVDPTARLITDFVISNGGRDYLVPFDAIASMDTDVVYLRERWRDTPLEGFDRREFREARVAEDEVWDAPTAHSADRHPAVTRAESQLQLSAEDRRLELREEELHVHKEQVEAGWVRLQREVVPEHATMDVPIRREEVIVEHHLVERRPSDTPVGSQQPLEVAVRQETVDVETPPVAYEQVRIGSRPVQETQHVSDSVRREELCDEPQRTG